MRNENMRLQDMIDFVTGSDSELSDLSEVEDEVEDEVNGNISNFNAMMETDSESSEEEDNAPLINLVNRPKANNDFDNDKAPDDAGNLNEADVAKRVYRWRKLDSPRCQVNFDSELSDPPDEEPRL